MNKLDDNKIIEDEELENAKKEAGMLKKTFILTTIITTKKPKKIKRL